MAERNWFEVQVETGPWLSPERYEQVVFHGVNKSGSLVLSDVLRQGYEDEGRGDEFLSHYHHRPRSIDELLRSLESGRRGFFVAHYLYGRIPLPAPRRLLFTQFRHPLPRIVSCYQWLLMRHNQRGGDPADYPTLEEFVRAGAGKAHSQIVQFGVGWGVSSDRERRKLIAELSPDRILQRAVAAIERDVGLIGIAEFSEESIFLIAHLCGLKRVPRWARDTRNEGRTLVPDLPPATVELIRETYAADFSLYRWAKQRFFEQLVAVEFGPQIDLYKAAGSSQYKDRLV